MTICEHEITDCVCTKCGEEFHDWEYLGWYTDDNTHQELKKCHTCGYENDNIEPHVPGADCTCTVCGADAHDWITEEDEIPATCTEDGRKAIIRCGNCTKSKTDSGATIPALGHIDENDDGICDRCYYIIVNTCTNCSVPRIELSNKTCVCGRKMYVCKTCYSYYCDDPQCMNAGLHV
jgi:hypothetical protein